MIYDFHQRTTLRACRRLAIKRHPQLRDLKKKFKCIGLFMDMWMAQIIKQANKGR